MNSPNNKKGAANKKWWICLTCRTPTYYGVVGIERLFSTQMCYACHDRERMGVASHTPNMPFHRPEVARREVPHHAVRCRRERCDQTPETADPEPSSDVDEDVDEDAAEFWEEVNRAEMFDDDEMDTDDEDRGFEAIALTRTEANIFGCL